MPRPLRIEEAGSAYHVTGRGVDRRSIFHDDVDRSAFVELLGKAAERFRWRVYAYCLMSNHFHLLVEPAEATLASGMHFLNGRYARRYNGRHDRSGHLFERRYHAVRVERDAHLLEACRYVVLNPMRASVVDAPGAWPWSSYAITASGTASPIVAVADVLRLFDEHDPVRAMHRYCEFVAEGIPTAPP